MNSCISTLLTWPQKRVITCSQKPAWFKVDPYLETLASWPSHPRVKIYIHDSAKDIFYELENLNEIKDRTILKLFETDGSGRGPSGMTYPQE